MKPDLTHAAQRCPVLSKARPDTRKLLVESASLRRLDRSDSLFLHETHADQCFVIVFGWIKLYRILPNGSEAIIRMHTAGETLAFADCLRDGQHQTGADAASEATVLCIPAAPLREVIASDPDFGRILLTNSFDQIDSLNEQLESLKCQTAIQRVACFLRRHARLREGRLVVLLPFEKGLVASYLGMKPESLSRALGRLKGHGVRPRREEIEISDPAALDALIHDDAGSLAYTG